MSTRTISSRTLLLERPIIFTLALLTALLFLMVPAGANGQSSARSMAMGGAHIGLASGFDAAVYNPANLGLNNHRQTGLQFAGVGASITNNSFSLDDYNKYTGAVLTDSDKDYLLSKIPSDGLRLNADVEATALSFSSGAIAFHTLGVASADVNLSKDILDLVLRGNTFADTIDVTGSYSDAVSYAAAGISYGLPIYLNGTRQLAVGATGKYVRGLAIEEVLKLEGLAATYESGYAGEGQMIARTATGGAGYAVDLGAAFRLNNSYTAGVAIRNAFSSISWTNEPELHSYTFSFDTMTVDNMDEDYVTSEDTTAEIASFTTSLPRVLTLGIANTSGRLKWAIDWQQGFEDQRAGSSTKPHLSVGAEWSLISLLPLRAGCATGGDGGSAFSFGSGLHFLGFYFDVAAVSGASFSAYSAKGTSVAVSTGLRF